MSSGRERQTLQSVAKQAWQPGEREREKESERERKGEKGEGVSKNAERRHRYFLECFAAVFFFPFLLFFCVQGAKGYVFYMHLLEALE